MHRPTGHKPLDQVFADLAPTSRRHPSVVRPKDVGRSKARPREGLHPGRLGSVNVPSKGRVASWLTKLLRSG